MQRKVIMKQIWHCLDTAEDSMTSLLIILHYGCVYQISNNQKKILKLKSGSQELAIHSYHYFQGKDSY